MSAAGSAPAVKGPRTARFWSGTARRLAVLLAAAAAALPLPAAGQVTPLPAAAQAAPLTAAEAVKRSVRAALSFTSGTLRPTTRRTTAK